MNKTDLEKIVLISTAVIAGIGLFPSAALADKPGSIRYKGMLKMVERFERYADAAGLESLIRVQSTVPDVRPGSIRLTIERVSGPIDIPIDASGAMQFPFSEALRDENPLIVSNQPNGTLAMYGTVQCPDFERTEMGFTGLMECVTQANAGIKKAPVFVRFMIPKMNAIELHYPPGSDASVVIGHDAGDVRFTADADGVILIPFDKETKMDNPAVRLSALPDRAIPTKN